MEYGGTVLNVDMEVWSMEREGSMDRKNFRIRLHALHVCSTTIKIKYKKISTLIEFTTPKVLRTIAIDCLKIFIGYQLKLHGNFYPLCDQILLKKSAETAWGTTDSENE